MTPGLHLYQPGMYTLNTRNTNRKDRPTMNTRGSLSRAQIRQLLQPIEPFRVVTGPHVKPHLSQQDVVAHLSRIFGFGNFDVEVLESSLIYEEPMTNSNNKPAWTVAYRALVRLTIRNEHGEIVAVYDGGSTGESEGQPSRAASHDLAFKSALSTATKRAAIHLGDQFGLSLYNKGQLDALVRGSLIGTDWTPDKDVQEGVPQQEEDGGTVADREAQEQAGEPETKPEPSALPPATKRATRGRQGTRKKAAPAEQAPAEADAAPDPTPEAPAAPVDEERAEREAMAAEQERQVTERELIIATAERVDRSDEAAVAAWNAEHGKATGHYITSDAERAAQSAKLSAEPAAELDTPQFVDDQTGDVFETQEELDASIKKRVEAKRAERERAEAAAPDDTAGPSAYEVATNEEPENYQRRAQAATTEDELKAVWGEAQAGGAMTADLGMLIVQRKDEIGNA